MPQIQLNSVELHSEVHSTVQHLTEVNIKQKSENKMNVFIMENLCHTPIPRFRQME